MESFSLLKYWHSNGAGLSAGDSTASSRATTFTTGSPDFSDDEEGPYFDLEFTLPDDNNNNNDSDNDNNEEEANVNEKELKMTFEESGHYTENDNVKISIEPSSNSKENSKTPVSLLNPATKFRVLLLKLKKSKSIVEKGENQKLPTTIKMQEKQGGRFYTVKLKVEEVKAHFTRDNSSKQNHCKRVKSLTEDSSDEKNLLTKEVMQKYLNMVKVKFSEHLSFRGGDSKNGSGGGGGGGVVSPPYVAAEEPAEAVTSCVGVKSNLKQGNNNLQAGLKVVKKHLGKSRSAPAAAPPLNTGKVVAERRDDSLLQLQDGIQSAILHCKRSFNGSRDVEASLVLSRSASDPSASTYSGEAKEIVK